MRLKKSFQLALNILIHSKLRSWLTIIGIIIGIAAVVSIVSISEGAQKQLEERLGTLGADILTLSPGASRATGPMGGFGGGFGERRTSGGKNLTKKDVLVLKSIENVKYVMGEISGQEDMTYLSKTASVSIIGVDASVWKDITTEKIDSGRFLVQGDSFAVVLGGNIKSVFGKDIPLNNKVIINGKSFNVVGILQSGSSAEMGRGGRVTVYMPLEATRVALDKEGEEDRSSISVKIEDVSISDETVSLITSKLMLSRGILYDNKKDFSVSSPKAMQETMQETMNTMGLFLAAIAAISLLVGGIGIANTMFTSVLEKTKEIGIMKAIGTKNKDILAIFLLNSGMIGLVGGIGGVILGVFGAGLIGYWGSSMSSTGMPRMFGNTAITPQLLIFALVFSVVIGMVAGAIPAYRASKLKPVDALRYE